MRNTFFATMTAVATIFAVSSADAALVSVASGPFNISALGGAQGYGVNLSGVAGDTFEADFLFTVVDDDAAGVGATTIENIVTANLSFTDIELFDSATDTLLASGTVGTMGSIDFGTLLAAVSLDEGVEYYIRTSGTFVTSGNAAIGGTVSLTPVPVPAALPLMVSAIAAVGLVGARRKS